MANFYASYPFQGGGGGGSGTVTSVAMTVPTFLSVAGSPITTSGTLAVSLSGTPLPITSGGTGTTNGSITGSTLLAFASGGTNQNITLTPSGSGNVLLSGNVGIDNPSPAATLDIIQTGGAGNPAHILLSGTPTDFASIARPLNTGSLALFGGPPFDSNFDITNASLILQGGDFGGSGLGGSAEINLGQNSSSFSIQDPAFQAWMMITMQGNFQIINGDSGAPNFVVNMPNDWVGVGSNVNPINTFDVLGQMAVGTYAGVNNAPTNGIIVSGHVGIGNTSPTQALDVTGNIRGFHYIGSSSSTSIGAGTGAGTSPTVGVTGTDASGSLSILTGTGPAGSNATIATITFNAAYGSAPAVVFSPANNAAAALTGATSIYVTSASGTFSLISGASALAATTTYLWKYIVLG